MTSGINGLHTPIFGIVHSIFPLQHKLHVVQVVTERCGTWQWGYESVHFVARYSFLHCRAGLDEAWMKWQCKSIWYALAANFTSGVGPCAGIVESFKNLLCVTALPQYLVFELQAVIGACLGQYSNSLPNIPVDVHGSLGCYISWCKLYILVHADCGYGQLSSHNLQNLMPQKVNWINWSQRVP